MKSIELTKEHKSKLLEMCNKLFPEYDLIEFGKKYHPDNKFIWMSKNNNLEIDIHWFEFCMTHLAPKICDGKTYYIFCDRCNSHKIDSKEFSKEFISKYLQHPVDYLYSEFLKLSK